MRKFFLLGCFCAACLSAFAAEKVVDKAGRVPKWVGGTEQGFLIVSGEGGDLETAKDVAFMAVQKEILLSIAAEVKANTSHTLVDETRNNSSDIASLYMSKIETKGANIPFLQRVTKSHIADSYWEKLKDGQRIYFRYHIKYPFSKFDLEYLVDAFNEQERKLDEQVQTFADDDFTAYNSIEEMTARVSELRMFRKSLMDGDRRVATCGAILDRYTSLLGDITLRSIEVSREQVVFAPFFGGKQLTTNKKPSLKTNCLTQMAYATQDGLCVVDFDFATACYPDEQNYLEVVFAVDSKKISQKFFIK